MLLVYTSKGKILIIDKNIDCWGKYDTPEWEQWFDKKGLSKIMKKYGLSSIKTIKNAL
jgi:malonyl-CoA O-methyltransferase